MKLYTITVSPAKYLAFQAEIFAINIDISQTPKFRKDLIM